MLYNVFIKYTYLPLIYYYFLTRNRFVINFFNIFIPDYNYEHLHSTLLFIWEYKI